MSKKKQKKREISLNIIKEIAPYAPKKELGTYHLRRWSWREKMLATQKATSNIDRERKIISWDPTAWYEQMLLMTVRKVPKGLKWNLDTIRDLDPDVGDTLQSACLEVNTLSKEDREGFLGRLSSEIPIPGSISTGPARISEPSQKAEE